MRTPGIIIFGLVLAPCGWILDLTSTVAPNWRTLTSVSGQPQDTVYNQGIWDMCKSSTTSTTVTCNQVDTLYFNNQIIPIAKGMMVASLIVTLIGLAVVTPGARCWRDRPPRWALTSFGAVLIFCSGALTIIPIAWYTYLMPSLNSTYSSTSTNNVGYCIVLGYIGGILEVLADLCHIAHLRSPQLSQIQHCCICCCSQQAYNASDRGIAFLMQRNCYFYH
uniref:Claudin 23.1 n=1 Tax=Astyanax mexicanus TaxID=7994 RepID=A0A3B1JY25_ASTMX